VSVKFGLGALKRFTGACLQRGPDFSFDVTYTHSGMVFRPLIVKSCESGQTMAAKALSFVLQER